MTARRLIPSIEELLQRPGLIAAAEAHGRARVTDAARQAAAELRAAWQGDRGNAPRSEDAAVEWLEARTLELLSTGIAPSLQRVINATGVVLHTNLGRAPLAAEALDHATRIAAGYSNLEYDLGAGGRGHRHVHAERLLCALTGAEAALVVNNNAAATLLVLAALASGRDVLVSRGELVEIGGGFRVPEVMTQSGARLREVGTTNRTRVGDYSAAISDQTALILRVHPSNFRIEGFTERPRIDDLAALAHRFGLALFEDLGSGWLGIDTQIPAGLAGEPSARASLAAGTDLVAFSGDKLLGGPQAGIVVGRRDLIDQARDHPLMRALRADKLTYAALETTLALWSQAPARNKIPIFRMLTLGRDEIDARARALLGELEGTAGLRCRIRDGVSRSGGGSAPEADIPTRLLAVEVEGVTAATLEARLRAGSPPVVARIQDDAVLIDLRTVSEEEQVELARVLKTVLSALTC